MGSAPLAHRKKQAHFRCALDVRQPIRARLTSMLDQGFSFDLRLTEISSHGLCGIVAREVVQQEAPLGPFWAEFRLPGQRDPLECVVHPTASTREPAPEGTSIGWAFCGADDPTALDHALRRLRAFARRAGRAGLDRHGRGTLGARR